MIRCACGSIQVVTKVARLRAGSPSSARSSPTSRIASTADIPVTGKSFVGTSWVRKRLPKRCFGIGGKGRLRHRGIPSVDWRRLPSGPASPYSPDTAAETITRHGSSLPNQVRIWPFRGDIYRFESPDPPERSLDGFAELPHRAELRS